MMICFLFSFLFFLVFLFLMLMKVLFRKNNQVKYLTNLPKNPHIAILIPARDESTVIENLILSIKNQTYKVPLEDVYIIVEDKKDLTVKIAKKYGVSLFIRKKLNLKSKGYALMELIEDLVKKQKFYDLYFIFDADNILDKNYLKEMLKDYHKGYGASCGYRALKNPTNYIAISSWLTFLLINEYRNEAALKTNGNILFSGTGMFINGKYLNELKTYPFHSLTEDYELSLYCTLQNIATNYNPHAYFYDDQPENFSVSIKQRSRWIKGYFANYQKYFLKLLHQSYQKTTLNKSSNFNMAIGILPIIFLLISFILLLIGFHNLPLILITIIVVYLGLIIMTFVLLKKEKLKISPKLFWQTCLYHPLFIFSYLIAFFKFLLKKDLGWDKIKHH